MAYTVFFYLMAAFVLFSAYFVVTARNLFRCAIGLIAVLLGVAGMYLLMDAQFLSAVQVTVYIGGIVVLIVFAILLIADVTQKEFRKSAAWRKGVAGAATLLLCSLMVGTMLSFDFNQAAAGPPQSASVTAIGRALLSPLRDGFILPFEVISLVLLAAMIGAVTVARSDEEPLPTTRAQKLTAAGPGDLKNPLSETRPRVIVRVPERAETMVN